MTVLSQLSLPEFRVVQRGIQAEPLAWSRRLFNFRPQGKQHLFVDLPFKQRYICIPTGHGVGKSYSVPVIVMLWAIAKAPCYVILSSADWVHVRSHLFSQLKQRMAQIPHPQSLLFKNLGEPGQELWRLGPGWEVIGISPNDAEVAAGWHCENGTLAIIDEASSIDAKVLTGLLTVNKSHRDCTILFGNPIRPDGEFANIILGDRVTEPWYVERISTEDNPNYQATLKAIKEGRLTHEQAVGDPLNGVEPQEIITQYGLQTYSWVENMRKGGENSSEFQSRVRGNVPDESPDVFIPRSWISGCHDASLDD